MKYEITKGSEKDFEGSPDGCVKVFRGTDCNVYVWGNGEWENEKVKGCAKGKGSAFKQYDWLTLIAERRPITEPVWDGEGLPPVGTKCECDSAGDWQECTVILSVDNAIVWQWDWQKPNNACISYAHCAPNFRPIRSPEAVARDEAVTAMFYKVPQDKVAGKDLREAIYDAIAAGRIPGVKLE